MYNDYFSFDKEPFSIAPDPHFLYPSLQHKEALDHILYGLNREGGFIVLTGEVGTGKTTLCRLLLGQLPENMIVATLKNSKLTLDDFMTGVAKELAPHFDDLSAQNNLDKTDVIHRQLLANWQAGKNTLLIIDEAQNLNPDVLEMARLLTNLSTDSTLLHILLIGQPELAVTLARPDLRQLLQRVIARYHLQPLSLEHTAHYITHRLNIAGGQNDIFSDKAVKTLYKISGGIPRVINIIAERSLQIIFFEKVKKALPRHIEAAHSALQGMGMGMETSFTPQYKKSSSNFVLYSLIGILFIAFIYVFWQIQTMLTPMMDDTGSEKRVEQMQKHAPVPVAPALPMLPVQKAAPSFVLSQPLSLAQASLFSPAEISMMFTESVMIKKLLERWGLSTFTKSNNLCSAVQQLNLNCQQLEQQTLQQIRKINRPGLITVVDEKGETRKLLLTMLTEEYASFMLTQDVEKKMTLAQFKLHWQSDFEFLWQAAPGYIRPLKLGDRSLQTVRWLQQVLSDLEIVEGRILTGGIYSEILVGYVKELQRHHNLNVDGILGQRTIMLINQLLGYSPVLENA